MVPRNKKTEEIAAKTSLDALKILIHADYDIMEWLRFKAWLFYQLHLSYQIKYFDSIFRCYQMNFYLWSLRVEYPLVAHHVGCLRIRFTMSVLWEVWHFSMVINMMFKKSLMFDETSVYLARIAGNKSRLSNINKNLHRFLRHFLNQILCRVKISVERY